jgi:hypothetical protein
MTNRQCYLIAFGCFDFGLLLGLLVRFYYGVLSQK